MSWWQLLGGHIKGRAKGTLKMNKDEAAKEWCRVYDGEMAQVITDFVSGSMRGMKEAYLSGWEECARQNKGSAEQQFGEAPHQQAIPAWALQEIGEIGLLLDRAKDIHPGYNTVDDAIKRIRQLLVSP